jgi:hypothetical protein
MAKWWCFALVLLAPWSFAVSPWTCGNPACLWDNPAGPACELCGQHNVDVIATVNSTPSVLDYELAIAEFENEQSPFERLYEDELEAEHSMCRSFLTFDGTSPGSPISTSRQIKRDRDTHDSGNPAGRQKARSARTPLTMGDLGQAVSTLCFDDVAMEDDGLTHVEFVQLFTCYFSSPVIQWSDTR